MTVKLSGLEPQRRDALLNAALKEFALKGYDGASTNVIAKEAGISKALMFHYAGSKPELFLFACDYFTELLEESYYSRLEYTDGDIFNRLRTSYLLQLELLRQYPWIFEFSGLCAPTGSDEVNKALENRSGRPHTSCCGRMFDGLDDSLFREGLDAEKSKQLILWANIGFKEQILDEIRNAAAGPDFARISAALDSFLGELRNVFYK